MPKRNNTDFFEAFRKPEPFVVLSQPVVTQYLVNVDTDFETVGQFENIVYILDNANDGDTMEIKLSTNGGALHAILPLIAAMRDTRANVYVHAVSDVASAGTFLLMAADDVYMNEYVTIMFHQVSFGVGGTGSSIESHVNHTIKSSKCIIQDMYKDFFTTSEIEAMLSGRDFYMGKDEFEIRYKHRNKLANTPPKESTEAPKPKKPRATKTPKKIAE